MEKYFVTKNISLKLKDFGFNENCIAHFNIGGELVIHGNQIPFNDNSLSAPMYEQVIDWLFNNYGVTIRTINGAETSILPYYSVFIHGNDKIYRISQPTYCKTLKKDGSYFNSHNMFGPPSKSLMKKILLQKERRKNSLEKVILMSLEYVEKFNHIIYDEPIVQSWGNGNQKKWESIVDLCENGDFPKLVLDNISPIYVLQKLIKQWENKSTNHMVIINKMSVFMDCTGVSNNLYNDDETFSLEFCGDTTRILTELVSHSEINDKIVIS